VRVESGSISKASNSIHRNDIGGRRIVIEIDLEPLYTMVNAMRMVD
jgi:hypothetical protein